MTRKHTSATDAETPINVVLVTLDNHVNGAIARAEKRLTQDLPGIDFTSFAATEWEADPQSLSDCRAAIAQGDIVIVTFWNSFDQHEKSHADKLFKETFSLLADFCDETDAVGYEMLWQGVPE